MEYGLNQLPKNYNVQNKIFSISAGKIWNVILVFHNKQIWQIWQICFFLQGSIINEVYTFQQRPVILNNLYL